MSSSATKTPKELRYAIHVDYEGKEGWRGGYTRWESTKNRAFLGAALLIGRAQTLGHSDIKVKIVDARSGLNVHKCGDDLYWLY